MITWFCIIKQFLENLTGHCDNCMHVKECDHIKLGGGHCWDNPYEPSYKKKGGV